MRVLIVDDEPELRAAVSSTIKSFYKNQELIIDEGANGLEAVRFIQKQFYELILMDVKMPELDGLEALAQIKSIEPQTFVVIMTAHSNLRDAVIAIKAGAYDYLEKPLNTEKLKQILTKAEESKELVKNMAYSSPVMDDDIDSEIIGRSSKMKEIFQLINKISIVDTTVLIRGENGTGKEMFAKAIHANSPRKNNNFVAINCAAIPDELIESELFGHEKGAFTGAFERKIGRFQIANNGTLFLDEIGELKPETQVKLLRFLQEKTFSPVGSTRELKSDARIITATNSNLEKLILEGKFREDLFYRLNVMPIFIPPLRERTDDLPDLINFFISKHAANRQITVHQDFVDVFKSYSWPGNIRELENLIQRILLLESSNDFNAKAIPTELTQRLSNQSKANPAPKAIDFDQFKENSEREFIINALKSNQGRINKTVANANIPKNTLLRKIKKFNIDIDQIIADSKGNPDNK